MRGRRIHDVRGSGAGEGEGSDGWLVGALVV